MLNNNFSSFFLKNIINYEKIMCVKIIFIFISYELSLICHDIIIL